MNEWINVRPLVAGLGRFCRIKYICITNGTSLRTYLLMLDTFKYFKKPKSTYTYTNFWNFNTKYALFHYSFVKLLRNFWLRLCNILGHDMTSDYFRWILTFILYCHRKTKLALTEWNTFLSKIFFYVLERHCVLTTYDSMVTFQ